MSDAVKEQTEALAKDVEVRVWFRAPAVQAALECEHADSPMHPCQYADMRRANTQALQHANI